MKALLLGMLVLSATLVLVPQASAEPCEVPGCNVVGAAVCLANETTDPTWTYKQAVRTVADCTTQTA